MKKIRLSAILFVLCSIISHHSAAQRILFNDDWSFKLGNADPAKDMTHGTDYFSYVTKTGYINSPRSPISKRFNDSSWEKVTLPHDWAVDLPFSEKASHSHGYKTIGFKYPDTSVAWYRKHIFIPGEDKGKHITIEFEGVFRNSEVFCNGFYLGHEISGYASRVYDLTECLDYGADNVIIVRCDASIEEGWFYEGAGIYRNVYLTKSDPLCIEPYGLSVTSEFDGNDYSTAKVKVNASIYNYAVTNKGTEVTFTLFDAEGNELGSSQSQIKDLGPRKKTSVSGSIGVSNPKLWCPDNPYLYTLETSVGKDLTHTRVGIRRIEFTHDNGMLVNGKRVQIKGADVHLDHAGVGSAVPDALWYYRIQTLAKYGFNTVRCAHNPATPAMLDACDELGFFVIDENRLMGTSDEQLELLDRFIRRDRNHPSVILWSIGNEEWGLEGKALGKDIASVMTAVAHNSDPSRLTVYASSGGQMANYGVDVFGYNYIIQNPVMENYSNYPNPAVGTEETTGSGTRGKYVTDKTKGWMTPINRTGVKTDERFSSDSLNVIERGWSFYSSHPQFAGVCYWTGFDYRGEPNPMGWPATGSQYGILDYCGFPKDEAFYLKSWWSSEPLVHICGPYEGKVWVYSNCEKVQLYADGKKLGEKKMPVNSHLEWDIPMNAKVFTAKGISGKKTVARDRYPELIEATSVVLSKDTLLCDGQDVVVIDITSPDEELKVSVDGAKFLGWGNGDPGFKETERPLRSDNMTIKTFSSRAQVLVRSIKGMDGPVLVKVGDKTVSIKRQ